eukprot:m.114587 g.114587  ORF g.114587 m.114587 type:complete len:590 (+) comp12823_c0_seq5:41-1810(+)
MVWVVDVVREERVDGEDENGDKDKETAVDVWYTADNETALGESNMLSSIDTIIKTSQGLKWFKGKISMDRHGKNSLNYFLVCKYYNSIQSAHKQLLADVICKEFLGPQSSSPARVSWRMANLLLAMVGCAGDNFFTLSMDEILWNLASKYSSLAESYLDSMSSTRVSGVRDSTLEASLLLEEEAQRILPLPRQLSPMKRGRSARLPKKAKGETKGKGTDRRGRSKTVIGRFLSKRENLPSKKMFTPFRHSISKPPKPKGTIDIGTEFMIECYCTSIHAEVVPHHINSAVVRYYDKSPINNGCEDMDVIAEEDTRIQRGLSWTPSAQKPNKLLQALKQVEVTTKRRHPVLVEGFGTGCFLVLYQDGTIIFYCLDEHTGDIISVSEDNTVTSKLAEKTYGVVCSAVVVSQKSIVFTLTHCAHIGRVLLDIPDEVVDCPFPVSNMKVVKKLSFDKKKGRYPGAMLACTGSLVFQHWLCNVEDYNMRMYTATDDLFVFMKAANVTGTIVQLFPRQQKKVFALSRTGVTYSSFEYTLSCSYTREQSFFQPHRIYKIRSSSPIVACDLSTNEDCFCYFTSAGGIMNLCLRTKRVC